MASVKVSPSSCAEALASYPTSIPDVCKLHMEITVPKHQKAIHLQASSAVSIFSPFSDSIVVRCKLSPNSTSHPYELSIGVSVITLPPKCVIHTKELRIFAASAPSEENVIPNLWDIDMSADLFALAEDLADLHGINISKLSPDFADFAENVNLEKLDLAEASASIKQFQKIANMENFNVAIPRLEELDNVTWTVAITAWVVALIIILASLKCCVSCCCPNIKCCSKAFEALWKIVSAIFSCIKCLVCSCHGQAVSQGEIPMESPQKASTRLDSSFLSDDVFAPHWEVVVLDNRAILMASLESGDIFFNHLTGDIENEHGSILKLDVRPSANTLNHYLKTVHSLPPPRLVRKGNLSVIEDDPEVAYDPRNRSFTHTLSKKRVCGYRLPVIDN